MKNIYEIKVQSPNFLSEKDETAFFERLENFDCLKEFSGLGPNLFISFTWPDESNLREIIALFFRYNIEMKCLSIFRDENNEEWFYKNKSAYWHKKIFI